MRKNGVFCLMSVIVFSGCSRMVSEESDGQEILFQGNIQELQKVDLKGRGGFVNDDKVQLYIVEQDGEGVKLPSSDDFYQMSSDADGNLNFTDGEKHIYPNNPIDIYGFYCKGKEGDPVDMTAMPIEISGEQLTEDAVMASDFLYVKSMEGYRASDEAITLAFGHQFSKIQFNFKTNTPETIDLTKIASIEVLNVVREGKFNIATGDLVLGEALDGIQVQAVNGAMAIILPQQIAGGISLFRFVVNEKERLYTVSEEGLWFKKGKLYKCDILINQYPGAGDKDVIVNTSIEEWDESEPPITIVFEDGQKVTATLTDVSTGVKIQQADLYVSSESAKHEILKVPVVDNKLEFIFPRETKGGTIQLNKAHFYTESGEEFDYYFKDKQLLGDNQDKLSLVAPQVGDAWAGGTIFVVGEVTGYNESTSSFKTNVEGINAYRGRVVSNKSLGKLAWCINGAPGVNVKVGANGENNGNVNMTALKTFLERNNGGDIENYPAFKACQDLGKGWYFPAYNEVRCIVANKEMLNLKIEIQSGTLIPLEMHGSSTEKDGEWTHYMGSDKNGIMKFPCTKITPSEVRPVLAY